MIPLTFKSILIYHQWNKPKKQVINTCKDKTIIISKNETSLFESLQNFLQHAKKQCVFVIVVSFLNKSFEGSHLLCSSTFR